MSSGEQKQAAVVLVHGIWMSGWEMALLGRRLRREGFIPYRFPYASLRDDPEATASQLAAFTQALPHPRIHLLGHSLGNRLIAAMIASTREKPSRFGRVLALAPPFAGSQVAHRLVRIRLARYLLGHAETQLNHPLPDWPAEYPPLGVIAGNLGIGIGRLFCRLPPPHDGSVTVAETRIEGMSAHITLHVSHFSMLFSREVADQARTFLKNGNFSAPHRPHETEG